MAVEEDDRTFKNTFEAFAQMEADLKTVSSTLGVFTWSSDEEMKETAQNTTKAVGEFMQAFFKNKSLFNTLNGWKMQAKESGDWAELNKEDRVYVNKVLVEFLRSGIHLSSKMQKKLTKLQKTESDLLQEYYKILTDCQDAPVEATIE